MKIVTFILAITLLVSNAFAGFINTDNLSEEQEALLKLQVEKMQSGNKQISTVEKTEKWIDIGERIGKAIGASAKELNLAVNDFANSKVGQISIFLIAWKVLAKDICSVLLSLFFLFIASPFIWYLYFKITRIPVFSGDDGKKIVTYNQRNDCEPWGVFFCILQVAFVIASITLIVSL